MANSEGKDPEIEVEITNDPGENTGADTTLNADEGIDTLKARLAESERGRLAAEQRANTAEQRVEQALSTTEQHELSIIEGGIQQLDTNMGILKANYATAMAEGDYAKASEINAMMAQNAAQKLNLENGKVAIETKPKREAKRAVAASNDPVEILAAQLAPESAAWIRAHPEYARDPQKNAEMMAAHYKALAKKLAPNSAEYFAFVDKELGIGYSDQPRETTNTGTDNEGASDRRVSRAAQGTPRSGNDDRQPSAAPARGGSNGSTRTVRLTPEQAEAAKISGLTNEEYWQSLQKMKTKH